jgi:hypothetical protein
VDFSARPAAAAPPRLLRRFDMREATRATSELVRQSSRSSSSSSLRSRAIVPQNEPKRKTKKKTALKIDRRASGLVTKDEVDEINRRLAKKNEQLRGETETAALMEEVRALHSKVLNLERENQQLRASLHDARSSGTLTPPDLCSDCSSRAQHGDSSFAQRFETLKIEERDEVSELKDLIARRPRLASGGEEAASRASEAPSQSLASAGAANG